MDFEFNDSIKRKIYALSKKFDDEYWREISSSQRFPEEYWNSLARSGFFGTLIEKKYGGTEKGLFDLCLATEETAEHYAGLGSYLYLSVSLVSKIFSDNATPEMKDLILPNLAKGKLKISIALTEEGSGTEASAIETKATKESGKFVLNGSKNFVNTADLADYLLIFARTAPIRSGKKSSGLTMFLIDADSRAIKRKKLEKLGMDFVNNFSIEIRDLHVHPSQIVGAQDDAWNSIARIFNMDRVATAASLVGTGRLALSHASRWARERKVFGRPIGENQGVQFPLADAAVQIESAELMMLKAASLADDGKSFANEASYALLESSSAAQLATDRALQTFGGHGYFKDYDVERYWRDVRVHKVHPISEELLLASIAERSLGLPRSY